MRISRLIFLVLLAIIPLIQPLMAQDKPAYLLYSGKGKKISYKRAISQLQEADIVFFGELHNNPIAHWLELEILRDLAASTDLTVGFEMFETDQQEALDKLASGEWGQDSLEQGTSLWGNYATDYAPVVDLCLDRSFGLVATNAPRFLARQVSKQGLSSLDTLADSTLALLAPLPITLDYEMPSYAKMRDMLGGHGGGLNADFFIEAQALKDATMAHRILQTRKEGNIFYHLNGSYHSDYHEGILWHIRQQEPTLKMLTISVIEVENMAWADEEALNRADIVILVPASMTKTY
ncbi:MAG: ChaN family lipoprotein [Bacteroidia bacterium]|nr:ChaN family lipoprotein [Bacteroidia bacterium]